MRMLCAAEPGPLAPPQPWRGAEPFSLAAGVGVNGEKPHQGVASKKAAPHQRQTACNSTTALGLSWSWRSGTAPGARVTYDYDAWGNTVNTTGSTPNVYLYRGEQYDPDLTLYYLRARYFNPLSGRFLTRDPEEHKPMRSKHKPLDPGKFHTYLYATGDPINRIDPRGRDAIIEYALEIGESDASVIGLRATGKAVAFDICEEQLVLATEWGEPISFELWAALLLAKCGHLLL